MQQEKKIKERPKDLDQIKSNISKQKIENPLFCYPCDKKFISEYYKNQHIKSKVHKRRVKLLKDEIYTKKEAALAGGLFIDR